jgi:ubiquinone/menaquinone biosynthesis C-methylase UbiE
MTDPTEIHKLPGQGKSSFDLIDPCILWAELELPPGIAFLDLGCGQGNYALAAAEIIGSTGVVYALDLWDEGIISLQKRVCQECRSNVKPLVADVQQVPLETNSVDVALMATVLHDLMEAGTGVGALREVARVLKPGGRLAIVEFDKIDGPPGPPRHIRLDPEEVENLVAPYGFHRQKTKKLGAYNYLITLIRN